MLSLGKLNYSTLQNLFKKYSFSSLSLDSNSFLIGSREVVVSTNPAIGLPVETLGFFAFHYSTVNVACSFAEPKYILDAILLPPKSPLEYLEVIMREFTTEAEKYGVEIIGGHTGTYKGIQQPLIVTTTIGFRFRRVVSPSIGDKILVVNKVGMESLWLASLIGKVKVEEDYWRKLTPLPQVFSLSKLNGVKLLHDVSEGGLLQALLDISSKFNLIIKVKRKLIPFERNLKKLGINLLVAPSYGTLVAIVESKFEKDITRTLRSEDVVYSIIGEIHGKGYGVYVDNEFYENIQRTSLDEVYGEVLVLDPLISSVLRALTKIEEEESFAKLIPEVGLNMVYAKENAKTEADVAGLSGRVVKSLNKPKICGKVVYGGSKHLAQVILAAIKYNKRFRAAVNIKASKEILKALKRLGLSIREVPRIKSKCPIADFIQKEGKVYRVYYHPGDYGIEPSIVILAEKPQELVEILYKISTQIRKEHF